MFGHNDRISGRQLRRMQVLLIFAAGIFVLPHMAAKLFGTDVFWGLLLFAVFSLIYTGVIYELSDERDFTDSVKGGIKAGRVIPLVQAVRQLIRLVFYVVLSVDILEEAQVPFMKGSVNSLNLLVVLPLMLVAVYGAAGREKNRDENPTRIEKQGRIYELIFWIIFIPFIIMVLFGLGDVDWHILIPSVPHSVGRIIVFAYALVAFMVPVENYFYLKPYGAAKGDTKSFLAVLVTVAVMVFISFAILGIYGVNGAGSEEMLTIAIMRYIKLPFGVLGRYDFLVVWFFMTGCFVLISQTLYFISYLLGIVFPDIKQVWLVVAAALIAIVAPVFLPDYREVLPVFMKYSAIVDLPMSVVMPLFLKKNCEA